jgi:Rad3-related DNA helicase
MVYKHYSNILPPLIALLLLMQLPISFFAQSKSMLANWQIAVRTAGTTSGYDIRIEQYRDKTNFFFKRIDSLRQRDMEKDPSYVAQRAAIRAATTVDEATYEIEKLASIIELFEVSRKDTLNYTSPLPEPALQSLLDSLINMPVDILSNNAGLKNEKQVTTGYSFHFIRYNGKKKTVDFFTPQPGPDSHPFLFRLITQTLGFYRKEKTSAIITTGSTSGY